MRQQQSVIVGFEADGPFIFLHLSGPGRHYATYSYCVFPYGSYDEMDTSWRYEHIDNESGPVGNGGVPRTHD